MEVIDLVYQEELVAFIELRCNSDLDLRKIQLSFERDCGTWPPSDLCPSYKLESVILCFREITPHALMKPTVFRITPP
jgi:hypothetical protein